MKEVRELVLNAALLGIDYDDFGLIDIEQTPSQSHSLQSILKGAEFTWDVYSHVNPSLPEDGDEHDNLWKELVLRRQAEAMKRTPNPRVYRVRVLVELEPLSDEESRRLVDEARERYIMRNRLRDASGNDK